MLGLLPFLFLGMCFLAIGGHRKRGEAEGLGVRGGLLVASVITGLWLLLGTELLSLLRAIRFGPVLAWWAIPTVVLAVIVALRANRLAGWFTVPKVEGRWQWVYLVLCLTLVLASGLTAAISPPNNWDSQVYHLPRQVRWMQQQSVSHYPAQDVRQLAFAPLAEFAGLHLMVLTGDDQWANGVQWLAYGLTAVAVSLIARELGAGPSGQVLAALFMLTIPAAYCWASNTKNGLVLSLWTCVLAWTWVRSVAVGRYTRPMALLSGAALGLMLVTKGTAFLVGTPICLLVGLTLVLRQKLLGFLLGVLMVVVALAINSGHFARNQFAFDSPIWKENSFDIFNATQAPGAVAANLLLNVAIHYGTPVEAWNDWGTRQIEWAIGKLGYDVNDERFFLFYSNRWPFKLRNTYRYEDTVGAPLHVLLLILLPLCVLVGWRRAGPPRFWLYALLPWAGLLMFAVCLKMTAFRPRLHMPILCLAAPALGYMWSRPGWRRVAFIPALLGFAVVVPTALWAQYRPLLPYHDMSSIFTAEREELRFRGRPTLRGPTKELVALVRDLKPATLSFELQDQDWEYPIMYELLRTMERPPRFLNFNPSNAIRRAAETPMPDVVVALNASVNASCLVQRASKTRYIACERYSPYTVYLQEPMARKLGRCPENIAFIGWERSEGLGAPEGPYPKWRLPVVRWGFGPRTKLEFPGSDGPMVLNLEGRRQPDVEQTVRVTLNGKEIAQLNFEGVDFEAFHVPLPDLAESNELVLEYSDWRQEHEAQKRSLAVLYRKLQVVAAEP